MKPNFFDEIKIGARGPLNDGNSGFHMNHKVFYEHYDTLK